MTLWDWAVRAYGAPEVERLCLELQDTHGQCVSLLLWAAWAAETGRPGERAGLERAATIAKAWSTRALEPLRAVRRGLKQALPDIDDDGREAVRGRVLEAELAAERLLLNVLEARMPPGEGQPRDIAAAMAEAARAWNGSAPEQLDALARAFPRG